MPGDNLEPGTPDFTNAIIRKEGNKWVLYSHDGKKKLGEYNSKKEAVTRLRQVEYFKHHKGKGFKQSLLDAFDNDNSV